MLESIPLQVFETRTLFDHSNFGGASEVPFVVRSGSRMLVTLLVTAIDSGTTVDFYADNSFASDSPYDTILSFSASSATRIKRVLSDYHNLFNFRVVVSGGNATFKVAVSLFDNAMTTRIDNAIVEVDLHHTTDVNGRFDSVRIGDGVDLLAINSDGSTNTVPVAAPDEENLNLFAETVAIAANSTTSILSYIVPAGKTLFLSRIDVGGENIAMYEVLLNSSSIARKRTYFGGDLSSSINFEVSARPGYEFQSGDIIVVNVTHSRPFTGAFEARLQGMLKG